MELFAVLFHQRKLDLINRVNPNRTDQYFPWKAQREEEKERKRTNNIDRNKSLEYRLIMYCQSLAQSTLQGSNPELRVIIAILTVPGILSYSNDFPTSQSKPPYLYLLTCCIPSSFVLTLFLSGSY